MATLSTDEEKSISKPSDVFQGCNSDHFIWEIDDILSANWEERFESEPFTMMNLQWRLLFFPKLWFRGYCYKDTGSGIMEMSLELLDWPSWLQQMCFSLIIYIKTVNRRILLTSSMLKITNRQTMRCGPHTVRFKALQDSLKQNSALKVIVSINVQSITLTKASANVYNLHHCQHRDYHFEWALSTSTSPLTSAIFGNMWHLYSEEGTVQQNKLSLEDVRPKNESSIPKSKVFQPIDVGAHEAFEEQVHKQITLCAINPPTNVSGFHCNIEWALKTGSGVSATEIWTKRAYFDFEKADIKTVVVKDLTKWKSIFPNFRLVIDIKDVHFEYHKKTKSPFVIRDPRQIKDWFPSNGHCATQSLAIVKWTPKLEPKHYLQSDSNSISDEDMDSDMVIDYGSLTEDSESDSDEKSESKTLSLRQDTFIEKMAAEIAELQSTVKKQQEQLSIYERMCARIDRLEQRENEMDNMMKRMDKLERELETQYKPRIKSLWNGLHGMNKITKSMQNEMKQIATRQSVVDDERKIDRMDAMMERVDRLETNLSRFMSESLQKRNQTDDELEAVRHWMCKEVKMPQYLDLFIENGFDHLSVIQALTMNDLLEMGIEKKGHRIRIVQAIAMLKATGSGNQRRATDVGPSWI